MARSGESVQEAFYRVTGKDQIRIDTEPLGVPDKSCLH